MLLSVEDKRRIRAAVLALVVGAVLLGLKFWAYFITNSQAIFSDALESIVNIVAAVLVIVVVYVSSRPADRSHPYGHGKSEFFSAAFEGGLVTFAALLIFFQVGTTLWVGIELAQLDFGILITFGTGMGNLFLGMYLISTGRKSNSPALIASGHHVISDFYTSAAVVLGLLLVHWTGILALDAIVAILVAFHLLWIGYRIARRSVGGLLDEQDPQALKELVSAFQNDRAPGIIQLHHVRVIRVGKFHHIDAHVVVPEFWTVDYAHDRVMEFEKRVMSDYSHEGEINFHIDPCRRAYCSACELSGCPVRKEAFEGYMPITMDTTVSPVEPDGEKH